MRGKKNSRGKSHRTFKKGTKVLKKNYAQRTTRGGGRL